MSMSMSMSMSMPSATSSSAGSSTVMSMASGSSSMSMMSMSSSMEMPTSTVSSSSSSSMDMSSMDMSSMSSMAMSSMSSMTMSSMSSMTMSSMSSMDMSSMSGMGTSSMSGMNMGTATSSSSSSMSTGSDDMGGMDMDMSMNYYLTPTYKHYPVLFHKLSADTSGKAFGIFLLIVVAAFVYKFALFVSWCLEVKWFKKWNANHKSTTASAGAAPKGLDLYLDEPIQATHLPRVPIFVFDIFRPSLIELFHDFIRAILTFIATMIIYMLMLAAMSFVLTYVFAVITGLTLAEVFFNRCKICMLKRWQIQAEIEKARTGANDCQCNPEDNNLADDTSNDKSMSNEKDTGLNDAEDPPCCCANKAMEEEKQLENKMMENAKLQEQSGNMDSNLLPAEKFR